MAINLKQYTGSTVTPTDDALLYDFIMSEQSGIFEGCEVTHLGANQLQISDGRGLIRGRVFTVGQQTILANVSPSGSVKGRLIVKVDLGNGEAPISLVTQAASVLPALTQQDINRDGTVFELPLATYDVTEVLISGLVSVANKLTAPIDDKLKQSVANLEKGKYNAAAKKSGTTVAITGPAGAETVVFVAPSDWAAGDKYTYNGTALTLATLTGEPVEDAWKSGSPIQFFIQGNKAFFKTGGMGKLPSDLSPLCPNFKVERNGGKVKISADKIQLNSYTNMVSGGVWAWGKTRPTKPSGENIKQWSRAELITTAKPYDGLYLGDVTPSDSVTETLIYLPENDSGSVKLVPFIVLSTDYLGGVYVMREPLSESMKATWGGSFYYPGNPVDSFLSATYLNSILDKSISDALLTCSVPVQTKSSTTSVETIDRKCWVPSYGELYDATFNDGTKMPYFNSTNRIAYINGGVVKGAYWTRTRAKGGTPYSVDTSGGMSQGSGWDDTLYIRPSFVLPKDFKIQKRPDGSYTVWNEQGLMTLADVEPSTGSQKVAFNIPETIKSGLATKYAKFVYGMKEYNGYPGGLFTRNDNGFASGKMYGALWTQTDAYNVLTQYATYEPSSLTLADRCLHSSIRKILMSVSVKSTDNGGAIHDNEVKCLLLSTREVNDGTYETGTPIPYYSVQANRIMKDASGVATEAWLRDAPSSPMYQFRFIGQDGQIGTKAGGSTLEIVPSICIPLDTPIRQLADGTYDLVPEDPALAQSISTMAETGTPVQLKDIPVSTAGNAVMLKIPESETSQREYLYLDNNYKNLDSCLALRKECLPDSTGPGSSNYASSSMNSKISTWKESLPSLVKKYLVPVSITYKTDTSSSSVSQMTESAFLPSEENMNLTTNYGDTKYEYFDTNVRRTAKIQDTETNVLYYTRDISTMNSSTYWWYIGITTSGSWDNVAYNGSAYLRPMLSISPETWFLDNGDDTYTFVGDEPIADLSIEIDWPEADPLIARQWVYNTKGVYQTMLLGGVASTEDAPAYSPVLANNTWEMIAQACADRDPILDSWLVGDEKDEVINGETLTFVIVGKDHDDLADGSGKAPLTFGMKNLMAETRQMNSSDKNSGSFAGSAMYSWLSGTIYPNLPAELKDAIKAVNKKTSSGGNSSSIRTDPMYLWLFSEIEVFGTTTYSYAGEGAQYPYFATTAERIKKLNNGAGAASYWWERSPNRSNSSNFCYVYPSGSASTSNVSYSRGVCFGFCV